MMPLQRRQVWAPRSSWAGVVVASLLFAVAMTMPGPAGAQSSDLKSLLDRVKRLENDIRTLNINVARGGGSTKTGTIQAPAPGSSSGRPALARVEVRLTALEEELRSLTGREEELAHHIDQINRRLDKLVVDVDFRLSAIEKAMTSPSMQTQTGDTLGGAPTATGVPPPPSVSRAAPPGSGKPGVLGTISQQDLDAARQGTSVQSASQSAAQTASASAPPQAAPSILPEGTPKERYTFAHHLLRQNRFDEAEEALLAFLQAHGDSPLASNARYWLGETHYVRGDFLSAAQLFLEGYEKDPTGGKAPDTLLKLGMSLANLDKKREACATFAKLRADFPDAPASIQRRLNRESGRGGCK
jgi:tol-pal system protein YbgF